MLLLGGEGNDQLVSSEFSTALASTLQGGLGDDWLVAGSPGAQSHGGQGNDTITVHFRDGGHADGGRGIDRLALQVFTQGGQRSDDRVVLALQGSDAGVQIGTTGFLTLDGFESLEVSLGAGDDYVRAGDLDDRIDLGRGLNTALAGGGDDTVRYNVGAQNLLVGGEGRDRLEVLAGSLSQAITLVVSGDQMQDSHNSQITGFEDYSLWGAYGNDSALFGDGDDWFKGGWGNDSAQGGDGQDTLGGGTFADLLEGEAGDDLLGGGGGTDTLTGGAGADHFRFASRDPGGDLVTDFAPGEDLLVVSRDAVAYRLPRGALAPEHFALGVATASQQFVYRAVEGTGLMELIFDDNGAAAGGEHLFARFQGQPDLDAGSILIA